MIRVQAYGNSIEYFAIEYTTETVDYSFERVTVYPGNLKASKTEIP
jgi:hypothetical protein